MNASHRHAHGCDRIMKSRWSVPFLVLGCALVVILFPVIVSMLMLHAVISDRRFPARAASVRLTVNPPYSSRAFRRNLSMSRVPA